MLFLTFLLLSLSPPLVFRDSCFACLPPWCLAAPSNRSFILIFCACTLLLLVQIHFAHHALFCKLICPYVWPFVVHSCILACTSLLTSIFSDLPVLLCIYSFHAHLNIIFHSCNLYLFCSYIDCNLSCQYFFKHAHLVRVLPANLFFVHA